MQILKYLLLLYLSVWLVVKGIAPAWNMIHSDFSNYYVSAKLVVERQDLTKLYDNDWFQTQIKEHNINEPGKFAPFPPITAWVMLPLTFEDATTAKRIWTIFNCLLLFISIWLICRLTNWDWPNSALLILATGNGLINNFRFGQLYLLIAAGILLSLYLIKRTKSILAGVILSSVTWLKYLPVIFTIGWIQQRNYRALTAMVLSALLLAVAQISFFGIDVMREYISSALLPHLDGQLNGQNMYSYLFQSFDSLSRNLFVYSQEYNPHPFIDWPVGRPVFKWVVLLVMIASVMVSTQMVIHSKLENSKKNELLTALPCLAVFVILPAGASYHFILLTIPMMLLLSGDFFKKNEKIILLINYSLIGFIPYGLFFKIADNVGLVFAYPRLWLVCMLFMLTLYLIRTRILCLENE